MLPLWRIIPRTQNVIIRGLYSGVTKPVVDTALPNFGQVSVTDSSTAKTMQRDIVCIEGVQGEQQEVSLSEARRVMRLATEYQSQGPSIQGTQFTSDIYSGLKFEGNDLVNQYQNAENGHLSAFEGQGSRISLNGCMQSNVPQPLNTCNSTPGYRSYLNMPGGGGKLLDKYLSGSSQLCHQSRNISTSTSQRTSQQGAQEIRFEEEEYLTDPTPQGIQGDNCVRFKLWMENCQRYNLPNCDEQLESVKSGRKTLDQVFQEQQEIIQLVVEKYKRSKQEPQIETGGEIDLQGLQDNFGHNFEYSLAEPCPQGFQGQDCANFQVWAHNCGAFGFGDCKEKLHDIKTGRRTLQDVFDEQDQMIRKIVSDFQQKRPYSTSSKSEVGKTENTNTESTSPHSTPPVNENLSELSQKDRLKRAVKEYGGTVIVFHVCISLVSLGGFYVAVSSGLDVVGILTKLGVGESILQSKIATGSTTFVVAYAVHKVFAPVRIAITLSCTPFIVTYLRRVGVLKPPKVKTE